MVAIVCCRSENDDGPDVLRWLDRMLIRLVSCVCVHVCGCGCVLLYLSTFFSIAVPEVWRVP